MQAYEITVDGCASGLGLGLDSVNRVTILKPGGPADACGLIAVGDRIVNVDGEPLGGLQLQQVLRPADRHVLVLEVGQMAASEARAARVSRWGSGSTSSPIGARGSRQSSLSPLSSPKGGHVHVKCMCSVHARRAVLVVCLYRAAPVCVCVHLRTHAVSQPPTPH